MINLHRLPVLFFFLMIVFCFSHAAIAGSQGKKALMIVAKSDFEQTEYSKTRGKLDEGGVICTVASTKLGTLRGNKGKRIESSVELKDVNPEDYDAVVVIGGNGIKKEWANEDAHRILRQAMAEGKVIAAICAAPGMLGKAGVLEGRKATAHPKSGARRVMKGNGCDFQSDRVVVDGNLITGNGPKAAAKFGEAIVAALNE